MLAALIRRFSSRDAATATVAQLAVQWGSYALANTVTEQAERIAELEAELAAAQLERDAALEALGAAAEPEYSEPQAEDDLDPLGRGERDTTSADATVEA